MVCICEDDGIDADCEVHGTMTDQEQAPLDWLPQFEEVFLSHWREHPDHYSGLGWPLTVPQIEALVAALKAAQVELANVNTDRDLAYSELVERGITIDSLRDDLARVEAEATQFREERDWETDKRGRAETRIAEVTAERDRLQAWNDSLYYGEIQARTKERDERITELEGSLRGGVEIGFPATKASRNALVNWLEGAKGVLEGGKSK